MQEIKIKFDEKTDLTAHVWRKTDKKPLGVVVIAHGMAEHSLRYTEFASSLADLGFVVFAGDHYAHGKTAGDKDKVGVVTDYDFMTAIIKSIKLVHDRAKSEYPDIKMCLFAHSMGSMAGQKYIRLYPDDFDKIVLCGTDFAGGKYKMAKLLTGLIIKMKGEISYLNFVENLGCGAFEKKFKSEGKTAWLSRNKESNLKFERDEFCGKQFPTNYYHSMGKMMSSIHKLPQTRAELPSGKVFVIAGTDDPVGGMGKGPTKVYKQLLKGGVDVKLKLYPGARHELLNEIEPTKAEVKKDVLAFYLS